MLITTNMLTPNEQFSSFPKTGGAAYGNVDYSYLSYVIHFWAIFMLLNAALTSNSIVVTTFVFTAKLHFHQ